jgi:hypothetical protein
MEVISIVDLIWQFYFFPRFLPLFEWLKERGSTGAIDAWEVNNFATTDANIAFNS